MIEVSNLTQTYRSGKGVFDLDFTIKKGAHDILNLPDDAGDRLDIHRAKDIHSPGSHTTGDNHVGPQ